MEDADLVIATGGLGPTADDLTETIEEALSPAPEYRLRWRPKDREELEQDDFGVPG